MICAVFRPETSRALDPHLHSHCIVFNATRDPVEDRWKAVQNHEMLRTRKYVENVYYHQLVQDLQSFGYEIENNPRGDFEITSISPSLCQRFSKRHEEIDQHLKEMLAQAPEKALQNLKDIRENIAQTKRARKI